MEETPVPPELPITFHDREMFVRMPRPEQLVIWQRTARKLQALQENDWNAAEVLAALERGRKIIDSVLVNEADKDWLDDRMLDGGMGLIDAAGIIQKTIDAFADAAEADGNRATKRAVKKAPAKKAVRKAVG